MAFIDILKDLVHGVNGGMAAAIMGVDGLPVEHYSAPASRRDVDIIGIEYGKVVGEIKNAAGILGLGGLEEILVKTSAADVILRVVSPEYYVVFIAGPDVNAGKARFLLRRAAAKTRKELA